MHAVNCGERELTELDFERLSQLADAQRFPGLMEVLDEVKVIKASPLPASVVTMYAQVDLQDTADGRRHRFVLCYPGHIEPRDGYISVLSPVGLSLIGLKVGAVARWESPAGQQCGARVMAVSRIAQFSA